MSNQPTRTLNDMIQDLDIIVEPDGDEFYAHCPALPGLHVGGDTEQDALNNARETAICYLQSIAKHGITGSAIMSFKIGQIVAAKAKVDTFYYGGHYTWKVIEDKTTAWVQSLMDDGKFIDNMRYKRLWRQEFSKPVQCMVLGQTVRQTGYRFWVDEEVGNAFDFIDSHSVWALQPVSNSTRYRKPIMALAEDILLYMLPPVIFDEASLLDPETFDRIVKIIEGKGTL